MTEVSRVALPVDIPRSSDAEIVGLLLSISKSTRAFIALLLAEIDLHPGQDQLLDRLEHGSSVSVSELAEQLAVRPSTVSKMLDRLIQKGLVIRVASHGDARRTMVELTDAGDKVRRSVHQLWQRLETDLHGAIPNGEAPEVEAALKRMDALLRTKLRRLR